MDFTEDEQRVWDQAIEYAKRNRTRIARRLTDKTQYPPEQNPVSVFMGGSPGAGKTETSKELVGSIEEQSGVVLRLDPDDLRSYFSAYTGGNSYLFQRAVIVLVEKTMDLMLKNQQSFLLDGTLSHYRVAERNISRSLKRGRQVLILFVYQHPEQAWQFVLAREAFEGRKILPEDFVAQFFGSQEVTEQLKQKFGADIQVDLLIKDNDGKTLEQHSDIDSLQDYLYPKYTRSQVYEIVGLAGSERLL